MITRIAPSPTGMFHLGTARTAYINYLAAKSTGGKFILRIDDTDVERNKEEYTQVILDSLDWLEIIPDAIYYQSKRLEYYLNAIKSLLDGVNAIQGEDGAVKLKAPVALPNSFLDTIAGEIPITATNRQQIEGGQIGSRTSEGTILLRANGLPTYQFASIVDDFDLGISHIIRGVDHITNTPKQIAIWNAINFARGMKAKTLLAKIEMPQFTHMGLIFKDKKKLSKRDGAASLLWYRDEGYKPAAMLDWMLRLGWSLKVPRGNKELEKIAANPIPKDMAIELFQKGNLSNTPCNYDLNKLVWLNKRY